MLHLPQLVGQEADPNPEEYPISPATAYPTPTSSAVRATMRMQVFRLFMAILQRRAQARAPA